MDWLLTAHSVTGLSQEDLEVMVRAVQAGASMYSGRHPCLALSTLSEEVIEELEVWFCECT